MWNLEYNSKNNNFRLILLLKARLLTNLIILTLMIQKVILRELSEIIQTHLGWDFGLDLI